MNTAVILAPTPWSFSPVAGLPLITRTALSALRTPFERIVMLAGSDGARLRAALAAHPRTRSVGVVEVVEGSPSIAEGHVTVIPGDCVVTPATLARVAAEPARARPLVFTRAGDTGSVIVCSAAVLSGAFDGGTPWQTVLDQVRRDADTVTLEDEACIRVADDASKDAAERQLFAEMRAATAASDGPMARWFDRTLSQWISRRLVRTPLRPNHITIAGTAIGLVGAWCIARGGYGLEVLGTLLFLCAVVLDGCDGEVARLKFQDTPFGHVFDVTTDNVVHVAIFIALGIGQYRQHPDHDYRLLITLFLGGVACAAAATYWCFLRNPPPSGATTTPRTIKGRIRERLLRAFESVMNRDFAYLLFVLALVHRLEWFFWAAAFGTYLFSAALLWVYRWRDAA